MGRITITGRGRRWTLKGHPWIWKDDIADGDGSRGELLPVFDPNQNPIGWGLYSDASKIAVRLVTRSDKQPNRDFWKERITRAIDARARLGFLEPAGACRLLAGDADGLPGFVVDRYADVLVIQSGCQGSDRMRDFLFELVEEVLPFTPRAVLDRSDTSVRRLEKMDARVEWIRGDAIETVDVVEAERDGDPRLVYEVSVTEGHKTGHYLDQSENRRRAARHAKGGRVLDAFCYDGLFGIRAALAGAESVVCLDQSGPAGERVRRNAERNGVADRVTFERANAMHELRERAGETPYDLVIVDPPAFARNRKEAEGAARGYRELNRRAISLVVPGGVLVTASCSFAIQRDDFLRFLADAAFEEGRDAQVFDFTGAAPDHPAAIHLPETAYLKCAFLRL